MKSAKLKKKEAIHKTIREICLLRHPYCVCCGRTDGILQGGHLIPKQRSEAVRYDLMNVFTQCSHCNSLHRYDTRPFTKFFLNEYGQEEYLALIEKSRLIVKDRMWELEETHNDLKQILYQVKKSKVIE